uniref:Uncharacterized protein n=1 Tax=Lambia antarctica TaxID=101717 RepID=A0A1L2EDR3_9CHLO|nr:hypothetical protein [Lambia antarctica]ANN39011.1 hypothetical protein [Lambia antarctica]
MWKRAGLVILYDEQLFLKIVAHRIEICYNYKTYKISNYMINITYKPLNNSISFAVSCQSIKINKFQLKHSFEVDRLYPTTLDTDCELFLNNQEYDLEYTFYANTKFQWDTRHSIQTTLGYNISENYQTFLQIAHQNKGSIMHRLEQVHSVTQYFNSSDFINHSLFVGVEYKNFNIKYNCGSSISGINSLWNLSVNYNFPFNYFHDLVPKIEYKPKTFVLGPKIILTSKINTLIDSNIKKIPTMPLWENAFYWEAPESNKQFVQSLSREGNSSFFSLREASEFGNSISLLGLCIFIFYIMWKIIKFYFKNKTKKDIPNL